MFSKMVSRYMTLLERHPMAVQMAQTGFLCGAGDVIAQTLIEKKPSVDWRRTANFGLIGTFFIAPFIRVWYIKLESMFGTAVTPAVTLKKMVTDQGLAAPFMSASIISLVGVSQGRRSLEELKAKLRSDYVDVLLTGWKLWPAAQLVNFYFVPFLLRPLFVSVVALFWNTYLAWRTNQEIVDQKQVE